jgi:16S rRNA processing protein RimM
VAPRADQQRICVGKIGAPHGVRGDVKLWSFTSDPLALADYGPLQTADGRHTFEIETLRPQSDFLVARFKGVADRTAAEKLRNTELYVSRDRLPPIEANDEFYCTDLIGLAAVDRDGKPLGDIVAVQNFGAGDLLELRLAGARDTVFVAFTEINVPEIDIANRRVVIALPAEIEAEGESEGRAGDQP